MWRQVQALGTRLLDRFTIAVTATIGHLLGCTLAAYAFARMQFRGNTTVYFILLSTRMIPAQVTKLPTFVIMRANTLIDTLYTDHASDLSFERGACDADDGTRQSQPRAMLAHYDLLMAGSV